MTAKLIIRMHSAKDVTQTFGEDLTVQTRSSTQVQYLIALNTSDDDVNDALEVLIEKCAGKNGRASQITIHIPPGVTDEESLKELRAERTRIFNNVINLGYKRKFQSPFTAVPSSRFRAVISPGVS
jgi:hypothetical protein